MSDSNHNNYVEENGACQENKTNRHQKEYDSWVKINLGNVTSSALHSFIPLSCSSRM